MLDDLLWLFPYENFSHEKYKFLLILLGIIMLLSGDTDMAILFFIGFIVFFLVEIFFSEWADHWLIKTLKIAIVIGSIIVVFMWMMKYAPTLL